MSNKSTSFFGSLFESDVPNIVSESVRLNVQLVKSGLKILETLGTQSVSGKTPLRDTVSKLAGLNCYVCKTYMQYSQTAMKDIIDQMESMVGMPGQPQAHQEDSQETASQAQSSIELEGYKGKTAQGAFVIVNPLDVTMKVSCTLSDFKDPSGAVVSSENVQFSPQSCELPPHEEAQMSLACRITKEFKAGTTYTAFITCSGVTKRQVQVTLKVLKTKK
ncbi:MAG: hypothetical protein ACE5FU_05705 [Nitrospinota bacterium]